MKAIIVADPMEGHSAWDVSPAERMLLGRPMLSYLLDLGEAFSESPPEVLALDPGQGLQESVSGRSVHWREESRLIRNKLAEVVATSSEDHVLLLRGDTPLVRSRTLERLYKHHVQADAVLTLLSSDIDNGFRCTVENGEEDVEEINSIMDEQPADRNREDKYASAVGILRTQEVKQWFASGVSDQAAHMDRFIADLARELLQEGRRVELYTDNDPSETMPVLSSRRLSEATGIIRQRVISLLLDQGVDVLSPEQTYIEPDVEIGRDTVIEPFVVIRNGVRIGEDCHIGPFCQIRAGTVLEDHVEIGNYVETKNSKVGKGTKAKHLSYLGDATIGQEVNIGAGTITANYDGVRKHRTTIEDHSSTGSNTVLIAPVTMKEGSKTGAGAVVSRGTAVEKGETVVGVPARRLEDT